MSVIAEIWSIFIDHFVLVSKNKIFNSWLSQETNTKTYEIVFLFIFIF